MSNMNPNEAEKLRQLFKNNANCYVDTHEYNYDTEPPIKVEGEVIQAMTEDTFVNVVSDYHATRIAAVELPSDDEVSKWFVENIGIENTWIQQDVIYKFRLWLKHRNATKQSRISELEREVEQLKAWNDSANERTEFWKNEHSKTANSYLNLLKKYNELTNQNG
jgi:hypothetical protein